MAADGSGIIGASELAETLAKFGQTLDADEVGKMVTQFDEDGDGCVNQDGSFVVVCLAVIRVLSGRIR